MGGDLDLGGPVDLDLYGIFQGHDTASGRGGQDVTQQGRQGGTLATACRAGDQQDPLMSLQQNDGVDRAQTKGIPTGPGR